MTNFSPASETNPLKIKLHVDYMERKNPSPVFSNRAWISSPAKRAEKSMYSLSFFQSGLKKERYSVFAPQ